ncbi:site-2 protease family protein [Thermococcus argininiproducens]|uniref:Site-2 protease family protein n=1 Tax=Thermococcus argininiproducens TaxID=2866384 RepID=A0A9E7SDT9_9EURY|nr:site-2 protease family protein [Thermococcus argininiproducens]USH00972.1 site-2 protease family protein [Thermococcus argininiproducens]
MVDLITVVAVIIGFWGILYIIGKNYREEKEEGLQIDFFVALWRTKRFVDFIDQVGTKFRGFWKTYSTLAIGIGFIGMAYVFYTLFNLALQSLKTKTATPGVQLVIPGITIPLWYGLVGLIVVMFVHELSHGFVARAEGLPLKSVGLVLFFVIPGAFVEPDEEALNKASLLSRLRVYAAGSMGNIVAAFTALLLLSFVLTPIIQPAGVEISNLVPGSPAQNYLQKGDVIVSIDGQEIKAVEEFFDIMNKTTAGQMIEVGVLRNGNMLKFNISLGSHPDNPKKGYLGVYPAQYITSRIGFDTIILPISFSLYWIYILNLGIGLMNLFPIIPLDGGKMLDDILKSFLPSKIAKSITYLFVGIGLFLLAINLFPALRNLLG